MNLEQSGVVYDDRGRQVDAARPQRLYFISRPLIDKKHELHALHCARGFRRSAFYKKTRVNGTVRVELLELDHQLTRLDHHAHVDASRRLSGLTGRVKVGVCECMLDSEGQRICTIPSSYS